MLMEQFKCKMFSIELYNFLLISVTDRIVLKRNVYILPYVKSTEHQKIDILFILGELMKGTFVFI